MKTYEFTAGIDEELFLKLEVAYFELEARQDIIDRIIQSSTPYNEDTFSRYHKEMVEYKRVTEAYKNELQARYIQPNLKDGESVSWQVDFDRRAIIIQSPKELSLPDGLYKEA